MSDDDNTGANDTGGEEKKRVRPNAGIPTDDERGVQKEPVFYYSRERRLEKASKAVRALYDPLPTKKPNLFRSLTATRPLAMLFGSIVVLSIMTMILSIYGGAEDSRVLDGNRVSAAAMKYQGTTFLVIQKTVKNRRNAYSGPVDILVTPEMESGQLESGYSTAPYRVFFSIKIEEEFRYSVPFEADSLSIRLWNEKGDIELKVKPR
jgi:hypothetical protein